MHILQPHPEMAEKSIKSLKIHFSQLPYFIIIKHYTAKVTSCDYLPYSNMEFLFPLSESNFPKVNDDVED